VAEGLGDSSLRAMALAGLARVALNTDVPEAVRLLRQAVDVTDGLADSDPGRSSALHVLGVALQMSGDLEAAREVMSARLSVGRSTGDEMSIAWTVNSIAAVSAAKGDHDRAATLQGMASAMLERAGGEWPPDEREQ
jgi:ATP/maltotriose-dependent transcriptional regulator MalT